MSDSDGKISGQGGYVNTTFTNDDGKISNYKPTQDDMEMVEKNGHTKEIKEYEPFSHREVEHPTTNSETLIHLLKGSLGTGILAMPKAFQHAGYISGSICTIIIGFICTYCIHMLIKSEYELCKRRKVPSLTYPAVMEAALNEGPKSFQRIASPMVHVVNAFLLIYQLGTCCVYVVFVASNIKVIADTYFESTDVRLFMLIILLPLILINWVKNLKYLAPFSTIANIITLVSFGIILYYVFREPITTEGKHAVGTLKEFPLFFGTVLFALEAIGVILPLENEMKTPKKFGGYCGVLNSAMIMIVILYVGMGLFGYLNYGSDVYGSITLNLPTSELPALLAQGMLAFAIYITHGLACYVAIDITWNQYVYKRFADNPRKNFYEYVCRTLLVLITFLLAVAIPNLELFISLFGALCLSALGLAFPAMIYWITFWSTMGTADKCWNVIKCTFIMFVGIAGLVIGTYTSLNEIVEKVFKA